MKGVLLTLCWLSPATGQAPCSSFEPDAPGQTLACHGLTYLAPGHGTPALVGEVQFAITTADDLSFAFANQMIAMVGENLAGVAAVTPPVSTYDALGQLTPLDPAQSLADAAPAEGALVAVPALGAPDDPTADVTQAPDGSPLGSSLTIRGQFTRLGEALIEMDLTILAAPLPGQVGSLQQTLVLRSDVTEWRSVAHYVSDTLFTLLTGEPSLFNSQILFVAHSPALAPSNDTRLAQDLQALEESQSDSHGQPLSQEQARDRKRLAFIDQTGGGLTWIEGAGDMVAYPTFLGNRFELAFVDQSDGQNALVHHHRLTGRFTPLVLLPDLQGAPALALGGRMIAFAGLESSEQNLQERAPTDIIVVDVEAGLLQPISIPGSQDRDPSFAPRLNAVAFISARETWAEVVIARLPAPLGHRDRTKGDNPLMQINAAVESLYGSLNPLSQPVWSPDGTSLAFIEHAPVQDHLLILDLAEGTPRIIASGPGLSQPTWGPQGAFIALVVDSPETGPGALLRLDLARGTARLLPAPFEVRSPSWSVPQVIFGE